MQQQIIDIVQDDAQQWVLMLACGHQQHVRHQPPWLNYPWVFQAEERQQRVGRLWDCPLCVPLRA